MVEETEGFLGRWARRKNDALQGKPLDEPVPVATPGPSAATPPATTPVVAQAAEQPEKMLSLDDVKLLTKDSDFKPFMASNVGPEVRNAAMKKLFTDPHFNVMDGLDTYIDDYSKSDPIPESMLRQMASAKFLKLFDDEEEAEKQALAGTTPRENANNPTGETVAQSYENPGITSPGSIGPVNSSQPESLPEVLDSGASQPDHAHTDLRLQPDHAPPAPKAGRGTP
jgi:hypothetical protein